MKRYPSFHVKKEAKPYVKALVNESCPEGQEVCVQGQYVGGQYGEMIWQLINVTDKTKLVGLVRGATVEGEVIPPYLFGRAFGDVYYLLGMSEFLYDVGNVPLYTLAVYNEKTIGFVFAIPPRSVLNVPEYGFVDMTSYEAKLVPVEVKDEHVYAIAYSPSEYLQYYEEIGQNLGVLPPAYVVKSYEVDANDLGFSFHERVVLEVPNQWVEEGVKLGSWVQSVVDKLKKLL